MAFHCYFDAACPGCGRSYIRFGESECCPACGSSESAVYDLPGELVHYARLTLIAQGHLELAGFAPSTEADLYVVLGYEVLEAARRLPELEPAVIAAEAARQWHSTWDEARCEHFRRFFEALLARWQAERHRPPAAAQVLPGATAAAPDDAAPPGSRTFRKKWQPKES